MSELTREPCWSCNGSGKMRDNKSENGKYIFHKIECLECGGSGQLDYLPCADCGSVIPAYLIQAHECED